MLSILLSYCTIMYNSVLIYYCFHMTTLFFKVFLQCYMNLLSLNRAGTEPNPGLRADGIRAALILPLLWQSVRILFSAERVCKLILSEWHSSSRNCDSFLSHIYNLVVEKTLHPNFLMLWSDIKEFLFRKHVLLGQMTN